MHAKNARPPVEIAKSIERKAANVRVAASELAARIDEFVAHLSNLPGRLETYCYGEHPDGSDSQRPRSLALHFHRDGKGWELSYGTYIEFYHEDPENPIDFKPLREAPLKFKIAAVKMFPDLLESMETEQDRMVERINKATTEFDGFMAKLKSSAKGGA